MGFSFPFSKVDQHAVFFNKESWNYFNFGKNTEFNVYYRSTISPNDLSSDTFKEFISGKHMENTKLNELQIFFFRIDSRIIFRLIVEVGHLDDLDTNFDHNISILGVL
jgi:hypothetical protein